MEAVQSTETLREWSLNREHQQELPLYPKSRTADIVRGHVSTGSRDASQEHNTDCHCRRSSMSPSMDLSSVFSSMISAVGAISGAETDEK